MIKSPSSLQQGTLPDYLEAALETFLNANGVSSVDARSKGITVILAPNGTVATAGVITLGTALPAIYAKAWIYLPAGAVVGGLAGLYYCIFSSTTVGQVYTNYFAPASADFVPHTPATLVAAVGSNGAYATATGADAVLVKITQSASSLGINGGIRGSVLGINNNTAGAKIVKQKFGATTLSSQSSTIDVVANQEVLMQNRGIATRQTIRARMFAAAAVACTVAYGTEDTTTALAYTITGQVAVATDYLVIESFLAEFIQAD